MQTLLDRSDRMAMYSGFELRVPFCDYRLPEEIVERKKSPYPKTHNPTYLRKVKGMLEDIIRDRNATINSLLNREYIWEILDSDGKAFSRPWFGQLMTGPQLMAYLCQVNMWLEKYPPKIEL